MPDPMFNHSQPILFVGFNEADLQAFMSCFKEGPIQSIPFGDGVIDRLRKAENEVVAIFFNPAASDIPSLVRAITLEMPTLPILLVTPPESLAGSMASLVAGAWDLLPLNQSELLPVVLRKLRLIAADGLRAGFQHPNRLADEQRYRLYIDHAPEGIFIADDNGRYTDVNEAACKMSGYSREELLQIYLHELLLPESREAGAAHFAAIKEKGEAYTEVLIRKADGTSVWWAVKGVSLPEGRFMGFISDISERKQSEIQKAESDKRYRDLVNGMEQGLALHELVYDASGTVVDYRFLEVNNSFLKIIGKSKEELIGHTVRELFPETEQYWIDRYAEVATTGRSCDFENYATEFDRVFRVNAYSPGFGKFATIVEDVTDKHAMLRQIKDSEQKYRMIAENVADVIFSMDLNLNTSYISPSVYQLNGYTVEENLAKPFIQLVAEEDRDYIVSRALEELDKEKQAGIDHERSITLQYRLIHKNGTKVDVEARVRFLRDDSGHPIGFSGLARDMTQRKQLERELRDSEIRFREVIEESQSVIWECDPTGLFTYVSPLCNNLLGYEPDELIGLKHIYDFDKPEQIEILKEASMAAFSEKRRYREFVHPVIHKDGHEVYVSSNGNPMIGENGELIGYRGVDQDVTQKVLINNELTQSRNNLRALMEAVTESLILIDCDGKVLAINKTTLSRLGIPEEKILNTNIFEYLPPDVAENRREKIAEAMRTKCLVEFEDQRLGRWVLNHIYPVINNDKVEGFALFGMDITERKLAEEAKLEMSHKLKAITEVAYDGIIMIDDIGQVVFWNQAAEKIFGFTEVEIMGRNLYQMLAPIEYHAAHLAAFTSFIKSGRGAAIGKTLELHGIHSSGKLIPIELSLSSIQLKGKWMAVGIVRDISERKEAAMRVEQGLQLKNMLYDVSNDGIVFIDKSHRVFDANDRFCQMLGYSNDEIRQLYTWNYDNKMKEEDVGKVFGDVSKINSMFESVHKRKDGSLYDVEVNAKGFEWGGQSYVVCVCRDISERRQAERELRARLIELERFNHATVDRELKMIELKKEINELLVSVGKSEKYKIVGA